MARSFSQGGVSLTEDNGEGLLLVEGYGGGGFKLQGRKFKGSILVTADGVYPVHATDVASLNAEDVSRLLEADDKPEMLLIGTGSKMALVPSEFRTLLEGAGIGSDMMDTGAAARTFNVLRIEGRRVAALLLSVD